MCAQLAAAAFLGWLWLRREPRQPSNRFMFGDAVEGLGDLAWTFLGIALAFGATGLTHQEAWLMLVGIFVPLLISQERHQRPPAGWLESYRRSIATSGQSTAASVAGSPGQTRDPTS